LKVISRPFQQKDFALLRHFLGEARQAIRHSHYLHVGDLSWQVFHMLAAHNPSDLMRLWQDEGGTLSGFVLVYPDFGMFDIQVHPHWRDAALEGEMLTWAQSQLSGRSSYTLVNENDHLAKTLLEAADYKPMGNWLYMGRALDEPIPAPQVPPTFKVSDMTEAAFTPRASALALAFGAEPQPERYKTFMNAPGYDPALDVVAVDASGQVAAFAMCWADPVSKVGEFEPVGTVPDFQRQGLGKAALLEGMRRLCERGMRDVIVIVEAAEEPAQRLYESVGLTPRWTIQLYGKTIP
jgi:mycothiol synthase